MITVNTTDPAESSAVAPLMEQLPPDLDYQVYCLGHRVAARDRDSIRGAPPQWGEQPETRG